MLVYPAIDPVAFSVGPFSVKWYSLAYITGILTGWWYVGWLNKRTAAYGPPSLSKTAFDDMVLWAVLGIILGGRLGYVLFYKPAYYAAHPLESLYLWHGGMSFHGGMLGVFVAYWIFSRRHHVHYFGVMDLLACAAPIGLCLGRLANFVNGELFGRATDVPWAMVFPNGGPLPRHPSQLYEASLEGVALFLFLFILARFTRALSREGLISGFFLLGYASARMFVEQFREPDEQFRRAPDDIGYVLGHLTMGQLLCVPMIVLGLFLVWRAMRRPPRRAE